MSDVDGLLNRLRCIAARESCKRGVGRAMNSTDVRDIIATIEQQRAEIERLRDHLIERDVFVCTECVSSVVAYDGKDAETKCCNCGHAMTFNQAIGVDPC